MIADHQEKWIFSGEISSAVDGMSVAEWLALLDEAHVTGVRSGGSGVGDLITGTNDYCNFFDTGGGDFICKNGKCGSRNSVTIDESLEGEGALGLPGGGDHGFADFHGCDSVKVLGIGNSREGGCLKYPIFPLPRGG